MIRKLLAPIKLFLQKLGLYPFFFEKVYENRLLGVSLACAGRYRGLLAAAKRKPRGEKIRVLFIVSEIAYVSFYNDL